MKKGCKKFLTFSTFLLSVLVSTIALCAQDTQDYYKKFKQAVNSSDEVQISSLLSDEQALKTLDADNLIKLIHAALTKNNKRVLEVLLKPPYSDKLTPDARAWMMCKSGIACEQLLLKPEYIDTLHPRDIAYLLSRALVLNNSGLVRRLLQKQYLDKLAVQHIAWVLTNALEKNNTQVLDVLLNGHYLDIFEPEKKADLAQAVLRKNKGVILDLILHECYFGKFCPVSLGRILTSAIETGDQRVIDMLLRGAYKEKLVTAEKPNKEIISAALKQHNDQVLAVFLTPNYLAKFDVQGIKKLTKYAKMHKYTSVLDLLLHHT